MRLVELFDLGPQTSLCHIQQRLPCIGQILIPGRGYIIQYVISGLKMVVRD